MQEETAGTAGVAGAVPASAPGGVRSADIHEISCSNCGAPLTYMQGEAVITCQYCGTTTMLAALNTIVTVESHFMLPPKAGRDEAISIASAWLGKGFYKSKNLAGTVRWTTTEAKVLPYWVVRSKGNTMWRGMQKKTRSVGSGKERKSEEYWEPAQGSFSEEYTWPVYAREDTSEFWGIRNIEPGHKSVFPDWGKFIFRFGGSKAAPNENLLEGKAPFSIEELKERDLQGSIVNGQIVQDRAERTGRDRIIERHAKKAEGKATRITDCDTTVDVQGVDLVYVPVWELEYVYRDKTYHMLIDASRKKVLSAEMPVGKWAKAVIFDVIMFLLAAVFAAIGATGDPSPAWAWILMGVFGGGGIAYSAWTYTRKE
jgi:LSD1 subclass zinc finger protein